MSKQGKVIEVKAEGTGWNATWVANQTRDGFIKYAMESGYYPSIGNSTATDEQRKELLGSVHDNATDKVKPAIKQPAPPANGGKKKEE